MKHVKRPPKSRKEQPNKQSRCPTRHPSGPWRCTKQKGHKGAHTAYVPVSDTASELRAWER